MDLQKISKPRQHGSGSAKIELSTQGIEIDKIKNLGF